MMTPPQVLVARCGGNFFVTPQGIPSYSENLFDCDSARGMTDHFFSTLRWCNATLNIETVLAQMALPRSTSRCKAGATSWKKI